MEFKKIEEFERNEQKIIYDLEGIVYGINCKNVYLTPVRCIHHPYDITTNKGKAKGGLFIALYKDIFYEYFHGWRYKDDGKKQERVYALATINLEQQKKYLDEIEESLK